ncbi:hypothetical protein [Mycolicibacterium sp.]|uniref:hypothetical protein n=1 Tax=Mycolicibacterium sp. TaxID=2320850 RepID=UPI0037CCB943
MSDPHDDYRVQAARHFGGLEPSQHRPGLAEHRNISLLPEEDVLFAADFTPSPILRHIKSGLVVTKDRVVVRHPQYIFFVIKVGHAESSAPIRQVCEVTTGRSLSRSRVMSALTFGFFGLFAFMWGLPMMQFSPIGVLVVLIALALLAFAAFQAWLARSLGLIVSHTGGGALRVEADKAEYEDTLTAARLIQQLLFGQGHSAPSEPVGPVSKPPVPVPAPAPRPAPAPVKPPEAAPTVRLSNSAPQPSAPPSIWRG